MSGIWHNASSPPFRAQLTLTAVLPRSHKKHQPPAPTQIQSELQRGGPVGCLHVGFGQHWDEMDSSPQCRRDKPPSLFDFTAILLYSSIHLSTHPSIHLYIHLLTAYPGQCRKEGLKAIPRSTGPEAQQEEICKQAHSKVGFKLTTWRI